VGRQGEGLYLLPTNQLLHPWGEQAAIKGRPVDLAFDSRKHLLAVLNSHNVLLLDGVSGAQMAAIKARPTSYTGLAFRPGDRERGQVRLQKMAGQSADCDGVGAGRGSDEKTVAVAIRIAAV
jgi:hypothetical protein